MQFRRRRRQARFQRLLVRAAAGLVALTACRTAPRSVAPGAQAKALALLASYRDREALSGFVGTQPTNCIGNTLSSELCEWQDPTGLPGGQPLAQAIATRDRVNLLCELPVSGAPRDPGSCTVHPRRSNRGSWKTLARRAGHSAWTHSELQAMRAENRRIADAAMLEADTLLRLSRLLGALPNGCVSRPPGEQVCTWRTSAHTFGHGTLSAWIGSPKSKKILLTCGFPTDGRPRARNSCSAEVGG